MRLGMSRSDALKTDLLDDANAKEEKDWPGCYTGYRMVANSQRPGTGKGSSVMFNGDKGLVQISVGPGGSTPEGIKIGSTWQAARKAYPDYRSVLDDDPAADGNSVAKVPGHSDKFYDFTTRNGKIEYLALSMYGGSCLD
ncbi:hypothetical protein GCM10023107_34780 [Actinoplanes octamycinicus]|nr:hypothetical protein Aoc01nite_28000 [Actinoplanes octamycinicus]